MTVDDVLSGDERHEVQPVRADVADRPQRAALVGLEPPVPVAVEEQPVLEVAAGDEPHVAERPGRDGLAGVLVERVEADVEVDRVDEAAAAAELDQLGRLRRRHRQRLLADDVLPGREDGLRLRDVQVVRRRHVDDVHGRVGEEVVERRVGARHAEGVGPGGAALGRAAEDAADVDADAPQRLDMDRADESRADDGRADVGEPPHPAPTCGRPTSTSVGSRRSEPASDGSAPGTDRYCLLVIRLSPVKRKSPAARPRLSSRVSGRVECKRCPIARSGRTYRRGDARPAAGRGPRRLRRGPRRDPPGTIPVPLGDRRPDRAGPGDRRAAGRRAHRTGAGGGGRGRAKHRGPTAAPAHLPGGRPATSWSPTSAPPASTSR